MRATFNALRRRNVFRVAVVSWLLAQIAVTLETSLNLPGWFDGVIVSTLIIGLPLAMLFAWAFEITPEGIGEDDGVNLNGRLQAFFKDKIISEQQSYSNLYGGAIFQIAKGNPEDAIPWLKQRVELGYADFDINHKVFDVLSGVPEFETIKALNNANSNRERERIEAQLATPLPHWVLPNDSAVAKTDR